MTTPLKTLLPTLLLLSLGSGCSSEKTCASDEVLCSGTCVLLSSDLDNCGSCGRACSSGLSCQAGGCVDCLAHPAACTAAVVAACFETDDVRALGADLSYTEAPMTSLTPGSFAVLAGQLYVASNGGASVSSVDLADATASMVASITGASDIEHLGVYGSLLYLSDATHAAFVAVDPATGVAGEVSLIAASDVTPPSPEGFDFAHEKAYVALAPQYGQTAPNAVAVVGLSTTPPSPSAPVTRIDLTPYAAPGALPHASRVLAAADGKHVYVTLNDLDVNDETVAGGHGRLVVIDTTADAVVGNAVDLGSACLDPSAMVLDGTVLWVACGFYDYIGTKGLEGGGLVPVDLSGSTPTVGKAISAPHALGSLALCGGFLYAGATESGAVLKFDPTAANLVTSSTTACPPAGSSGAFVSDLICAP